MSKRAKEKRRLRTLVEPFVCRLPGALGSVEEEPLEVSAHEAGPAFGQFLPLAFPELHGRSKFNVVVVIQPARMCIMEITQETEEERLRLYTSYVAFAERVRTRVLRVAPGAFLDYADMDGTAVTTTTGAGLFNEVEVAHAVLGYQVTSIGGVSVVVHPRWGTNVYVGSIITAADKAATQEAIGCLRQELFQEPSACTIIPGIPTPCQAGAVPGAYDEKLGNP